VRRGVAVVIVALATPFASGCGAGAGDSASPPATAAGEQSAELGWKEQTPPTGPALVFRVHRFTVTATGWEADVEIENTTSVVWQLATDRVAIEQTFGLMLFATGELDEVERRGRDGELPGLRPVQTFDPPPPERLLPGRSWRTTISAGGTLAAGRFVRVVFGLLNAEGDPPAGMADDFFWITDHAYRLRS
jgi:hypothetical protein